MYYVCCDLLRVKSQRVAKIIQYLSHHRIGQPGLETQRIAKIIQFTRVEPIRISITYYLVEW